MRWMFGGRPTPPTPKKRNKRNEGRKPRDRRNHGKGVCLSYPFRRLRLSQCCALLAGGDDLRTGGHRSKKAKKALEMLDSTPVTRILKNTAAAEEPNCMMSLSSALCKYSIGAGRKKWAGWRAREQCILIMEGVSRPV